jgi:hypothetical protein
VSADHDLHLFVELVFAPKGRFDQINKMELIHFPNYHSDAQISDLDQQKKINFNAIFPQILKQKAQFESTYLESFQIFF